MTRRPMNNPGPGAMSADELARITGDLVSGEDILADEIEALGEYVVVTTTTPWSLHEHRFPRQPQSVVIARSLELSALDILDAQVPENVDIVGLGGGTVIDIAKYLARSRGRAPILVPTAISSNGPFSNWISVRRQGRPAGFQEPDLPRRIVVDYAVVRQADARLNRAGYGDLLPLQTTLNDWEIASGAGEATVDHEVDAAGRALMQEAIAGAREIGSLSNEGIELLLRLHRSSTGLMLAHPAYPINAGSEHLFAWTFETLSEKHVLHGELVALGIVISSFLQGQDHDALKRALDEASVAYHPDTLGLTWDELQRTLLGIDHYNKEVRRYHTVFDHIDWTPELLRSVREIVYRTSSPSEP